jgi:hypothetical protein
MAKIKANDMTIENTRLFVALLSLDKDLLASSSEETKALYVRSRNALNKEKKFVTLSTDAQAMVTARIAKLGDSGRDYLFQRNYKTLDRILDAARMIDGKSTSSILGYVITPVKRSKSVDLTVSNIRSQTGQCYARVSNAIKALAFFDLVRVHNASYLGQSTFVDKLSDDSRVEWLHRSFDSVK